MSRHTPWIRSAGLTPLSGSSPSRVAGCRGSFDSLYALPRRSLARPLWAWLSTIPKSRSPILSKIRKARNPASRRPCTAAHAWPLPMRPDPHTGHILIQPQSDHAPAETSAAGFHKSPRQPTPQTNCDDVQPAGGVNARRRPATRRRRRSGDLRLDSQLALRHKTDVISKPITRGFAYCESRLCIQARLKAGYCVHNYTPCHQTACQQAGTIKACGMWPVPGSYCLSSRCLPTSGHVKQRQRRHRRRLGLICDLKNLRRPDAGLVECVVNGLA